MRPSAESLRLLLGLPAADSKQAPDLTSSAAAPISADKAMIVCEYIKMFRIVPDQCVCFDTTCGAHCCCRRQLFRLLLSALLSGRKFKYSLAFLENMKA